MDKPWRAKQFMGGYSAEWLPPGQSIWRIVKSGGEAIVFPSRSAALDAAQNTYLQRLNPTIRATVQIDPEKAEARMEAKMLADAESWLKSKREDVKRTETIHRPGRKKLIVMTGRAS
ncbi:MAG: hypothetical protein WA973_06405 [Mesorhizobium sp.]